MPLARVSSRASRGLLPLRAKRPSGSVADPSLSAVINRAKAANMPKDNIERAIAKGISKDANDLEQVVYEAYGPGGVAIIIDALTDSRNRTTQEIKHLLSENGIELATPGAASWAFTKSFESYTPNEPLMEVSGEDEAKLGEVLNQLDEYDDVQAIYTNARGYESVRD